MKKALITVAVIAGLGFGGVMAVKQFNAELYSQGEAKVVSMFEAGKAKVASLKADAAPVVEQAQVKATEVATMTQAKVEPVVEVVKEKATAVKVAVEDKVAALTADEPAVVTPEPVIVDAVELDAVVQPDIATEEAPTEAVADVVAE